MAGEKCHDTDWKGFKVALEVWWPHFARR